MKRPFGSALALFATMLLGAASPPASGAPSSSPPLLTRPMLAPEGWMFATTWVRNRATHRDDLRVMAASPSGEIREVARFDPAVGDQRAERAGIVSVDGFLPVIFDWSDDADGVLGGRERVQGSVGDVFGMVATARPARRPTEGSAPARGTLD